MAEVQTPAVSSFKDTALLILSIIAILAGIAAFYWFDEQGLALRIGMVVAGIAAGAGLMWLSVYGKEFVLFARPRAWNCAKWFGDAAGDPQYDVLWCSYSQLRWDFSFFLLDWVLTWMTRFLGGTPI